MHSTSFPLWSRCLGNCSAGDSPDICWGSVVHRSCFLGSSLCSSLGLVPCSCLCSLEPGCYSSIGARWMNCTGACFVPVGGCCSIGGAVVGERKIQSFYFLRTRFGVVPLSGHWRGPSQCVPGR